MNHVLVARRNFDGNDVAGELGGEGQFSRGAEGAVFGHEDGAAAGDALEDAEESSAAGELGVGRHLDRAAHPGELSGFGDDGVVGIKSEFENGHGGAGDAALHGESPEFRSAVLGFKKSKSLEYTSAAIAHRVSLRERTKPFPQGRQRTLRGKTRRRASCGIGGRDTGFGDVRDWLLVQQ